MYFKSNFKIIYKKNPLEVFQIKTHKSKNAQKYLGEWEYLFNVKQTKNLLFTKLCNLFNGKHILWAQKGSLSRV